MSGLLSRALNPLAAAIAAAAGGIGGGAVYLSLSGILFGIILTLGLLGVAAAAVAVVGQLGGVDVEETVPAMAAASAVMPAARPSAPAVSTALNGHAPVAAAVVASTLPPGAPIAAVPIEATETEAQLIAAGRFADYHLAKGKRAFAAGNFKEAAYQASASLAHGEIAEAAELRAAARGAGGTAVDAGAAHAAAVAPAAAAVNGHHAHAPAPATAALATAAPAAAPAAVAIASTLPAGAPIAAAAIEATESEAKLIADGRFAEYHLAKAKRAYAAKNYKDAAYQASASLAHGITAEAESLRRAARDAGGTTFAA